MFQSDEQVGEHTYTRATQYFSPFAFRKTVSKASMVGFNTYVCNIVTISSKFADLVEFNYLQESVKVVKNSIKMVKSQEILLIILWFILILNLFDFHILEHGP